MSNIDPREDEALDALMAAAFLQQHEPLPDLSTPPPVLSADDSRALRGLGSDLVQRIMEGDWSLGAKGASEPAVEASEASLELTGAMYRSEEEGELSEEEKEKIERKVRELDQAEEERRTKGEQGE